MPLARSLALLLLIIGLHQLIHHSAKGIFASSTPSWDYDTCDNSLGAWAIGALQELADLPPDDENLKHLLYFLHIPRTGGRTYHQCMLRHLFPPNQQCQSSYDRLRYNSSRPCRLLVSHDDYSVVSQLPVESTSIITNIRDPVDRIFSAYDFSITTGSWVLNRVNKTRKPTLTKESLLRSNVLNIWPWRFLVPWMQEDLYYRKEAREQEGEEIAPSADFLHYNASTYMMPLHEFIYHPIAVDLLHNGATYQIAGLTNNSFMKEAGDFRKCVLDYPDLGHHVLNVAKRRLDRMIYVGLTEKHKETATLFSHVVGGQVLPLGQPANTSAEEGDSYMGMTIHRGSIDSTSANISSNVHTPNRTRLIPREHIANGNNRTGSPFRRLRRNSPKNVTVYGLIELYERCASKTHDRQLQRVGKSLQHIVPMNYSLQARGKVAEETLEAIRQLNWLDMELHRYAQLRFSQEEAANLRSSGQMPQRFFSHLMVNAMFYVQHPSWFGFREPEILMLFAISAAAAALSVCLRLVFKGKLSRTGQLRGLRKGI